MAEEIRLDENGVENMDGVKGSHVVGTGVGVGGQRIDPMDPIKENEIGVIAGKIFAAKGTPEYEVLLQDYTGPNRGLVYDEATGTCKIADGWTVKDGVVVKA